MITITSSKNPLIKEVKSLHRKKERMKSKSFIMEGIKVIEEAIDTGFSFENIIYSDRLLKVKGGPEILERVKNTNKLIHVTDKILKDISDMENPQGILAIGKFKVRELSDLGSKANPFLLLLDELQDPGNLGTIIRTADAFSADGIIITDGCVDPYNPKVVRATMGSIFRVPIYYISTSKNGIKYLKDLGIKVYSTSLEGSKPIHNMDYQEGFVMVIGNESRGVSDEIYSLSDDLCRIPMSGDAESLNAGIAASIIMYEAMKQRF